MSKELLSAVAIGLTFALFYPYIRSVLRGTTKPHVFSWVIWGLGTVIVFFAQLAGRGGLGAWPIGVSGAISCYIAWLAYRKRGDTKIVPADWFFLAGALSALPLWFFTSDPLAAVIILTAVDTIGFGPTLRRSWHYPREENLAFFALCALRNAIAIAALEHLSLTTALFPAVVGIACVLLSALLVWRRRILPAPANQSL